MENLKASGLVEIYVDGVLVNTHRNLVVDTGLDAFMQVLLGDATFVLSNFEAGDGVNVVGAADTALQNSTFGPKAITSVLFPQLGQVKVTLDIIPGEATGQTFGEFGLFTVGGVLIARIVDGNLYVKTLTNTIQVVWTITLTA